MSIQLNEEQYTLVRQYLELLSTIEEGLQYVQESFNNFDKTEGDLVLADVIDALVQIDTTHLQLLPIFSEDMDIVKNFGKYSHILAGIQDAGENLLNPNQKVEFVNNYLSPAFQSWKNEIKQLFTSYLH